MTDCIGPGCNRVPRTGNHASEENSYVFQPALGTRLLYKQKSLIHDLLAKFLSVSFKEPGDISLIYATVESSPLSLPTAASLGARSGAIASTAYSERDRWAASLVAKFSIWVGIN